LFIGIYYLRGAFELPDKLLFDHVPIMSDTEFLRFSNLIYDECGINLPINKKIMLTTRLLKRLRRLEILSFKKYYDYICSSNGRKEEMLFMLDVVSTNKTDFFREADHFNILNKNILPQLLTLKKIASNKTINIWSAGCSTGQEPYSIAMVVDNFLSRYPDMNYSILATDISVDALEKAQRAIYPNHAFENVPGYLQSRYLMRGTGPQKNFSRIVPEIRNRIKFKWMNLNDKEIKIRIPINIIFCRNVVIYFDRKTQIELFCKFHNLLVPGGYLFIGHSETLNSINDDFYSVSTTVYQKLSNPSG